jgi:hypothetical protein
VADAKISALTAIDAVAGGDLFPIVDDPAGTPVTKRATAAQIKDYIVALANTWTATQTITPAANTSALVVSGASLTGSNEQSLVDLAATWNTTGAPTAIRLNVTNTASDAASLLMDLQTGGTSRLAVSRAGRISSALAGTGAILLYGGFADYGISFDGSGGPCISLGTASYRYRLASNLECHGSANVVWCDGGAAGPIDLYIGRRAAANLRFGAADAAAPVAQTLSVQSVEAGTTNTAGANFTIAGSQGTGTGAGGSIVFQTAAAGSSGTAQNALATTMEISGGTGMVTLPSARSATGQQQLVVGRIVFAGEGFRVGNGYVYTVSNGANYSRGIGASAGGGFVVTNGSTGGESLEFREMTAPAAPATN